VFFNRTKAVYEIGPLYTASLVPQLMKELYPDLASVPGFDALYRMAGVKPPKKPPG
jgi:hypothetical protein